MCPSYCSVVPYKHGGGNTFGFLFVGDGDDNAIFKNGINLKTVNPRPREAIVLEFNLDKLTMNEVAYIAKKVQEYFPNNKVLAIPNSVSLYSLGKDVLENYISMVSEIIEEGDIS